MIAGIGIDIVEIERVEKLQSRFGQRFAHRILTQHEFAEYERRQLPASFLASRFAAKEAVAKAFGTGIGEQLSFQSIQVENDAAGKPLLRLLDKGADLMASRSLASAMLSLSDERHYVVAMVVLES